MPRFVELLERKSMKNYKIILFDLKIDLIQKWEKTFPKFEYPFLSCVQTDFKNLKGTAIVSPANSFGFMNGGIDEAYTKYFGLQIVDLLQSLIKIKWGGELPIGCAEIVQTNNKNIPFLISAPTMRVPMAIEKTINVYLSTKAALQKFEKIISKYNTNYLFNNNCTILIPGMGTGIGKVSVEMCASQMKYAIDEVYKNIYKFPKSISEAFFKHCNILQN